MFYPRAAIALALVGSIAGLTLILRRFLPIAPMSPVYLAVGLYVAVAVVATAALAAVLPNLGFRDLRDVSPLVLSFPGQLIGPTAAIYLVSAAAILVGALLFLVATGARSDAGTRPPSAVPPSAVPPSAVHVSPRLETAILFFALVPLVLIVVGSTDGIATLLERSEYIEGRTASQSVFAVGMTLGVSAVVGAGYVWASSASTLKRRLAIAVLVMWILVFFSLASRSIAVSLFAFALGIVLGRRSTRRGRILLAVTPVAAVVALGLALYLRGSTEHGLIPYASTVMGNDPAARVPTPATMASSAVGSSFVNVGVPAFQEPKLPSHDLWVSVNPLPGPLTGWYRIEQNHQIDATNPYSALGELVNYGWPFLIAYCMAIGAVLAYADVRARTLLTAGQAFYGILGIGIAVLVPIISMQYPLRSVSRLLYYTLAVLLVAYLVRAVRQIRRPGTR